MPMLFVLAHILPFPQLEMREPLWVHCLPQRSFNVSDLTVPRGYSSPHDAIHFTVQYAVCAARPSAVHVIHTPD